MSELMESSVVKVSHERTSGFQNTFDIPKVKTSSLNQFSKHTSTDKRFAPPWKSHRRLSSLHKILLEAIKNDSQISEPDISEKLQEITQMLLRNNYTRYKCVHIVDKVKDLEVNYRNVMTSYLKKFKELAEMKMEVMTYLEKSMQNFRLFSRSTTQVNLVSSLLDVGIMLASSVSRSFLYSLNHKMLFYLSTFTVCASITGSLFAITYMRNASDNISRMLKEDKYMQIELETIFYKGNWIDDAVQKLFPHGVNLSHLHKVVLERNNYFESEQNRRQYMCFVILLSNIQKDMQLLKDEEFLMTVKVFVESPAAQIWWNRMKIRKLMEDSSSKTEENVDKVVKSSTEVFLSRAAFNLYPVIFPVVINSWNSEKTRVVIRTIAAILAAFDLENNETTELKEVRNIVRTLQRQYRKMNKVYETMNYEYD